MNKPLLLRIIALLLALSCLSVAFAAGQHKEKEVVNDEAWDAAKKAELPEGLTDREAELYRQAYAYGYFRALHPEDTLGEYILNTSSHKFHYPSCQGAASIAPKNRQVFHGTREEAIEQGYNPCGMCKP